MLMLLWEKIIYELLTLIKIMSHKKQVYKSK